MSEQQADTIRQSVRENYARVARAAQGGCCGGSSCCSGGNDAAAASAQVGYSADELGAVPQGANLGLGCGNPQAIAALKRGETVLDLGSGGGLDSFLAARQVGEDGRVIGVDMTPEMVQTARENARRGHYANVEFRLGEIEALPVADNSVDVIISNCVINLSPEKSRVFREAYRVLKPGGRLAISDVVATSPLPEAVRHDAALISGCLAGAALTDDVRTMLREAGFIDIRLDVWEESRHAIRTWAPGTGLEAYVASATIEATKPGV